MNYEALLEEACEAMEALDKKGYDAFSDELGDVLLQVVFHAQIGEENGTFNIDDVLFHVCNKLITRHTHIFGNDKSDSCDNALDIWEANKKAEKGLKLFCVTIRLASNIINFRFKFIFLRILKLVTNVSTNTAEAN